MSDRETPLLAEPRSSRAPKGRALAAALAITCCRAGAEAPPPPPRPPAAPVTVVTADPCEGFGAPLESAPAPPPRTVSLDVLSGEARQLEANAKSAAPIDLGRVDRPAVAIGRTHMSGRVSPFDLSRMRFPIERAKGLLPSSVLEVLGKQEQARGGLMEIRQRRDPSPRAARCESQRASALELANRAAREALGTREEPVADVLAAERDLAAVDLETLEGGGPADPLVQSAIARAKRARDRTQPGELVGFFARYVLSEALLFTSDQDGARAEMTALIGRSPADALVVGEAELRAAELEPNTERRHALFLVAAKVAQDIPYRKLAGLAGAVSACIEDQPDEALRIAGELAAGTWGDLRLAVDDLLGEIYAALLPERPGWWTMALPALAPAAVQHVAVALASEAERRGDRVLARRLRMRAAELGADGPEARALRLALSAGAPTPTSGTDEARERVAKLRSECDAIAEGHRISAPIRITLDRERRFSVTAPKADDAYAQCLRRWGPDFLLGLPALRATLSK